MKREEIRSEQMHLIGEAVAIIDAWPAEAKAQLPVPVLLDVLRFFEDLPVADFPRRDADTLERVRSLIPSGSWSTGMLGPVKQPHLLIRLTFVVAFIGCRDSAFWQDEAAAGRIAWAQELAREARQCLNPNPAPPPAAVRPMAKHLDRGARGRR